eukprot:3597285-Karenia_brevis.AAC.1
MQRCISTAEVAVVRSWQGAALIGVLLALLILALGGDLADFFEVEKVPESRTKKSKATRASA